jgi:hypothetical protein
MGAWPLDALVTVQKSDRERFRAVIGTAVIG